MSALKPDTDSTHDLGTDVLRWRNLYVDGITVTDDINISGNLNVTGNTTTLTTQALFVEDPLIKLNKGDSAAPANDQGFVFSRGNGESVDQANRVLLWDESEDEFAFGVSATEDGTTAGNVAISEYADVSLGKLVLDSVATDNIEIASNNLTLSSTQRIALTPGGSNNADHKEVLVTGDILPVGDATFDLGSSAAAWNHIFLEGDITMSDAGTLATGAGALTINGAGGLDLKEGGTSIITISDARAVALANLTTLDITPSGAVDLTAGGAITIDSTTLSIGGDGGTGAITVDSTAGISLDGAANSNFTLSDGDLSLIASGADNKVVVQGGHTAGVAIHIDGNANANSEVRIDAGILDVDVTGAATIDAASLSIGATGIGAVSIDSTSSISLDADASSHLKTSAGDITIEAEDDEAKVVIKGDATHAQNNVTAIHLDGNTSARSVVKIDAGFLDIDADAAVEIDAAGSVSIESSGGVINLGADAVARNINIGSGNAARTINMGHAASTKLDLKALDVDVAAGTSGFAISGAGGSSLTTSDGALTITAAAASTWSTNNGALDITAAGESTWQTQSGALNITGAGTSTWKTSGGELSISGKTGLNLQEDGTSVIAIDTNRDVLFSQTGGSSADPDVEFDGYVRFDGSAEFVGAVQVDGATTFNNTLTVGANTDGHDVKLFGASDGQYLLWDESADELVLAGDSKLSFHDAEGGENISADDGGVLSVNAGTKLAMTSPTVEVNAETAVTIQGEGTVTSNSPVSIQDTLTVGSNGTGFDVQLFGDSAGKHLIWDQAADELALIGSGTKLSFFDKGEGAGENISADDGGILSVNAGTKLAMTSPTLEVTSTSAVTLDTPSMVVSSSTASKPVLELKNTNDDATGPTLKLALDTDNSAAPNDVAGTIEFFADDSSNDNQSYGEIKVVAADITSGSESGKMTLGVATTTAGAVADIISITGGTNASTSTVQILGNLSVIGTTTTVDQGTMIAANSVTFEGSNQDAHETVLTISEPTGDRTITLPDLTGHVPLLAGAVSNANVTATEFALLDGDSTVSTETIANGDGIFTNDGGEMKHVRVQDFQTYFDANSVGGTNIVTTGALNAGSITSGFGSINNGASAITTTGLGTFGSLDVDDVVIDGTTIGHTDDTDLLTLADAALTLKGTLTVGSADAGHDVTLHGSSDSKNLMWDASSNTLELTDSTSLLLGGHGEGTGNLELFHDGTDNHIRSREALNIATEDQVAVAIGNTTSSTTTIGQDLTVNRNLTADKLTVNDVVVDGKVITMTGSADDTATFTAGPNGTLQITTVDGSGTNADMTLTAGGAFEAVSAAGKNIILDSGGAINLEPAEGSAILLDNTISVDAGVVTGATSITSTAFVGTLSTAAQPNVTSLGTLTGLGVNGDATFTGANANMVWDKSDDALEFADNAKLLIGAGDGTTGQGDLELYHDSNNSHIVNRTGTLNIANAVNVPVSIGHASSTTTVGGDLSVTGNIDSASGDLTVATVTMSGFTVDADGDTALKSLAVDDGSTIGCDSDTDLLTLADAALTLKGTLTVGVNDTGHDVKLFGATTDKYLLWDESSDALQLTDSTPLLLGAHGEGTGNLELFHDGTDNHIRSREALNIATEDQVAVTIGNTTSSTTTIGDNFVVNGITTQKGTFNIRNSNDSGNLFQVVPGTSTSTFSGSTFTLSGSCDLEVGGNLTVTNTLTSEGSELKIKDPQILIASEGPDPFDTGTSQDIGFFGNNSSNANSQTYLGLVFDNSASIWRLQDSMSKAANDGTFTFNGNPSSLELGQIYLNDYEQLGANQSDGTVSTSKHATLVTTGADASIDHVDLGAGTEEGQVKVIIMEADGGDNLRVDVAAAGWAGGAGTITLTDRGHACTLQYINSSWWCIGNNGCTLA